LARESGSKAKQRAGVPITRKEFTAIPIREMNLLWTDRSTSLKKKELPEGKKLGWPRRMCIEITGTSPSGKWEATFEFTYSGTEIVHAKPSANVIENTKLSNMIRDISIVHVPPFSGISVEETGFDIPYQDYLIGQSKPGDIVRNLLLSVYDSSDKSKWTRLYKDIFEIFGMELLPPRYEGLPYIICEYRTYRLYKNEKRNSVTLDIASAGSGFLQVLMLLGFFYARPASVLLLDEPDAHLHVILQKQVYDKLRKVSLEQNCQLIIATHSEVLVDNTSPERIMSFFHTPCRLVSDTDRDRVREALKRLTTMDILSMEQGKGVLYLEGQTDFDLLREWAMVLNHTLNKFFKDIYWHSMSGRNPKEARDHFFALQGIKPEIRGVIILDGDNRNLSDHEINAQGMTVLRWKRYEAENYLIHPQAIARFVEGIQPDLFSSASAMRGLSYLKEQLPPAVYNHPLQDHDYLNVTPASKTLLPGFFDAANKPISKNEYYQIASQMLPEEIPEEVREKLDAIYKQLGNPENLAEE
jgi:hypothetical protein